VHHLISTWMDITGKRHKNGVMICQNMLVSLGYLFTSLKCSINPKPELFAVSPKKKTCKERIPQPKNTVAMLNELRHGLIYKLESQTGPVHAPLFTISVEVRYIWLNQSCNNAIGTHTLKKGGVWHAMFWYIVH